MEIMNKFDFCSFFLVILFIFFLFFNYLLYQILKHLEQFVPIVDSKQSKTIKYFTMCFFPRIMLIEIEKISKVPYNPLLIDE